VLDGAAEVYDEAVDERGRKDSGCAHEWSGKEPDDFVHGAPLIRRLSSRHFSDGYATAL
jgi:hypothetical protein